MRRPAPGRGQWTALRRCWALAVGLACLLLPSGPARAERPPGTGVVTRVLAPVRAEAPRRAAPSEAVKAPAPTPVFGRTLRVAPRGWPKVRLRLFLWWRALLR